VALITDLILGTLNRKKEPTSDNILSFSSGVWGFEYQSIQINQLFRCRLPITRLDKLLDNFKQD